MKTPESWDDVRNEQVRRLLGFMAAHSPALLENGSEPSDREVDQVVLVPARTGAAAADGKYAFDRLRGPRVREWRFVTPRTLASAVKLGLVERTERAGRQCLALTTAAVDLYRRHQSDLTDRPGGGEHAQSKMMAFTP